MMMGGASMWSAAETGGVQSFFLFFGQLAVVASKMMERRTKRQE